MVRLRPSINSGLVASEVEGRSPLALKRSRSAKRYSNLKYSLAIIDIFYVFVLLLIFSGFGLSKFLAKNISQCININYLILPVYILIVYVIYYVLDFPLNFYRSFIIEHKFGLSNQKIKDWFKDQFKAGIISYIITLILLAAFYYVLRRFPAKWWLIISIFWIFFSLILAKLLPIVIVPLFFKYKKFSDEALKEKIIGLAQKMKVKILDVFEIDLSKKTLKANAAFVGVGKTRRVILADTLKDKYSDEEIEVILAHEFAHYRLKHLLKLIFINSFATMLTFYIIFKTSNRFLEIFGFSSLSELAALSVILIYLVIFGIIMQPFENYISRRLERNADMLALKTTGLRESFISMMEKLASQNLTDRNPSSLIKFFFFDHPPVDERIAVAKS